MELIILNNWLKKFIHFLPFFKKQKTYLNCLAIAKAPLRKKWLSNIRFYSLSYKSWNR